MNLKSFLVVALTGTALGGALLAPPRSNGQAVVDDPALTALIGELRGQQAALTDNQAKIDIKLAAVSESLRQARIYAGRVGGKAQ